MIQFGTGGWRARIGEDFTCDNVRRVGGAVCAWLKGNGRTDRPVIIGYDRRFLSCEAAKWLAEVFCAQDFQVLFLLKISRKWKSRSFYQVQMAAAQR